jgi:hypothetical protein
MTLRFALRQAPEHIEGKEKGRLGTPRSCDPDGDPDVGFSQAPEHVEGGLLYEEGGGSARLIADDCLNIYLFNLKKRYKRGKFIA